jgi:hypothetical protein
MKFEGLLTNPLPVLPRKIEYSEFLFCGPRDKQQHLNLVIIGQGRIRKIWKKFKRQIFFSFFQIRKGALSLKLTFWPISQIVCMTLEREEKRRKGWPNSDLRKFFSGDIFFTKF